MTEPKTLPQTDRYFQPEISRVFWFPIIAAADLVPTAAEFAAAIDISDEIKDLSGFSSSGAMIATPDYGHRFVSQISGRITTADSSITFYADLKGDDIRKVLPRGTKGFLGFCDSGTEPGLPMDVFAVEVTSVSKLRTASDQAFQITETFAIKKPPAEDVKIPARA